MYHWVSADGEQYGFGTYDPKWVQHYVDKDYLRIDPVVSGSFQRFHLVDLKRLDWSSRAARAFRKDAIDHGIGNQGFTFQFAAQMASLRYSRCPTLQMTMRGRYSRKLSSAIFCLLRITLMKRRLSWKRAAPQSRYVPCHCVKPMR